MVRNKIIGEGRPIVSVGLAITLLVGAAGCSSDDAHLYLGHSDKVTSDAGDAVATNDVAHTVDPWSRASRNTRIGQDGHRARIAADRYAADAVKQPEGLEGGTAPKLPGGNGPSVGK